ncbi:cyclase family protein [Alicyclobacillus shizuokensis]|uniref:cyclase family protein n=1 Tax=Alicyclobacillus shizuokensis TaxID=392014 RepID=UPI0008333885|nr:cyclase family protein [Alicyclobacillus shizuokensis]
MAISLDKLRVVDLSVTVSESLPSYWPSHMPFSAKVWNYYTEVSEPHGYVRSIAPYQTRFWIMDEHCGTHFDAPTHFIPHPCTQLPWSGQFGAQSGDKVPLEDLMGPGVCIDVTQVGNGASEAGVSPYISVQHIQAWERENGPISGEIVLFYTGWDRFYVRGEEAAKYSFKPLVEKSAPGWPAPNVETILYLYDRGVRCIGIDAPSIGAAHDGASAHQEGLSRGMRYVELLSGLSRLPARGFTFMFLPVKVEGSTGGPGRAIALVER